MYNEVIDAKNKIISSEDLIEIFNKMNEKLKNCLSIYNRESLENKNIDFKEQKWTFKDFNSYLHFHVDFTDSTSVKFDNYESFITTFNTRISEIKSIYVFLNMSYYVKNENIDKHYLNSLDLTISNEYFNMKIGMDNDDKRLQDVYEFIKERINNAPIKYDDLIKKRTKIILFCGLPLGLLISSILLALLLIVPEVRYLYSSTYVIYPILSCILGFIIGQFIGTITLGKYYSSIIPRQKYAGYDSSRGQSMYKDDVEQFTSKPEVLIGSKCQNLEYRQLIMENKDKFKNLLWIAIFIIIIVSIISIFLGE